MNLLFVYIHTSTQTKCTIPDDRIDHCGGCTHTFLYIEFYIKRVIKSSELYSAIDVYSTIQKKINYCALIYNNS